MNLCWLEAEPGHQLLVGPGHHLRAGQVDGVFPGPVVVQQVGETEELGLEDGGVAPVDWSVLTGGEDVTPGVLRGGSI